MFAIVILHYVAQDITEKCVNALLKNMTRTDYQIIIVDNGSSNGSFEYLSNRFLDCTHVDVISTNKNIGFANGNNYGYSFAKEQYHPEFIVVMNNDVIVDDPLFLDKIVESYENNSFAIMGPDIYSVKEQRHQNPQKFKPLAREDVVKLIRTYRLRKKYFAIYYSYNYIYSRIINTVKKMLHYQTKNPYYFSSVYSDIVLHGACYIISKDYSLYEDVLFDPRTFLYVEEDILYYRCKKKGYRMVYDPSLTVNHLEDVSTNRVFKNDYSKTYMKYTRMIDSLNILLDVVDNK